MRSAGEPAILSRRRLSAALLGLTLNAACARQDGSSADASAAEILNPLPLTQSRLDALRARGDFPALAAAAQSQTGRALNLATGLRMRGGAKPATVTDQWHLGSICKSMTATLVARLVEAGAISWNDTIGDVLGPRIGPMRESYERASYVHLLSHRAGFERDVVQFAAAAIPLHEHDARATRLSLAKRVLRQVPVAPPGAEFYYSNSHYLVVAAMLETQLGAPWETLIRAHVFDPLGMSDTGFGPPVSGADAEEPVGHASWLTNSVTPHPTTDAISDVPAAWTPVGRVHASTRDVMRFMAAHRDRETPFLRAETWRKLHTPPFGGDYALGWHLRHGGLWHNGFNTMWYAEAIIKNGACSFAACNDGRQDVVRPDVHAALMDALRAVS